MPLTIAPAGAAVRGEAGAARAINIYREEIDRVLAQLGCCGISDITRDCLRLPGEERSSA